MTLHLLKPHQSNSTAYGAASTAPAVAVANTAPIPSNDVIKLIWQQKGLRLLSYLRISLTLRLTLIFNMETLNRLKAVLAEKQKTSRWLAEELEKSPVTVSKWCTNSTQPDLLTLSRIAKLLDIDLKDLIVSTKE